MISGKGADVCFGHFGHGSDCGVRRSGIPRDAARPGNHGEEIPCPQGLLINDLCVFVIVCHRGELQQAKLPRSFYLRSSLADELLKVEVARRGCSKDARWRGGGLSPVERAVLGVPAWKMAGEFVHVDFVFGDGSSMSRSFPDAVAILLPGRRWPVATSQAAEAVAIGTGTR